MLKLDTRISEWQMQTWIFPDFVVKVPNTAEEAREAITRDNSAYEGKAAELELSIQNMRERFDESISILRENSVPATLLANPIFLSRGVYVQDRVHVLGDYIRNLNGETETDRSVAILEGYVDAVHALWSYGIHESTFNFTCNFGVNILDEVVLIDLGELSTDIDAIESDLANYRWERSWSYIKDLPLAFKNLYTPLARSAFSVRVFQRVWRSNFDS